MQHVAIEPVDLLAAVCAPAALARLMLEIGSDAAGPSVERRQLRFTGVLAFVMRRRLLAGIRAAARQPRPPVLLVAERRVSPRWVEVQLSSRHGAETR